VVVVVQGNKREVPGDIPVLFWWDMVLEYEQRPDLLGDLAFYDPIMELIPVNLLLRLKAQLAVWHEILDEYPDDIAVWWPVRLGRRHGYIPHTHLAAQATIDDVNVLHCDYCGARWSAPHPDRCKLCDRIILVPEAVNDGKARDDGSTRWSRAIREVPELLEAVQSDRLGPALVQAVRRSDGHRGGARIRQRPGRGA